MRRWNDGLDPLPAFVPPHETLSAGPYPLNFLPRKHKDSLNCRPAQLPPSGAVGQAFRQQGTVNNVTSAKLTDLGGGGTFYDYRVEVERWGAML